MLPKENCNVIEMFPQQKRDFSSLIPQTILPTTEKELAEILNLEDSMADSEGMDAMTEPIFNGVIETLLEKGKTRDVLMFTLQANFGIRHSDLIKLKLINLIDVDGKFRDKVNWCEQKTSKTRTLSPEAPLTCVPPLPPPGACARVPASPRGACARVPPDGVCRQAVHRPLPARLPA